MARIPGPFSIQNTNVSGGIRLPQRNLTARDSTQDGKGFNIGQLASKIPGLFAAGVGAFGLHQATTQGLDFDPTITREGAEEFIGSQESRALSQLKGFGQNAKQQVASGAVGRGLISSGQPIGDIADIDMRTASTAADISTAMTAQLQQLLQYIDQRDAQLALTEQQTKIGQFSDLGELGILAAQLLL